MEQLARYTAVYLGQEKDGIVGEFRSKETPLKSSNLVESFVEDCIHTKFG